MSSLKEKFDIIFLSSRKFDNSIVELTMNGCGSFCTEELCVAKASGACRGCTNCDFFNKCPQDGCEHCYVRCGRHTKLQMWLDDVEGLDLDMVKCLNVFNKKLPFFIPQIRDTSLGVEHDVYLISFSRFFRLINNDIKWLYRKKKTLKEAYQIPEKSKMILHFYAKDDLLEIIWRFQDMNWGEGKNLWDVFAEYGFDGAISVNYSCFANQPRMEHVINVKRNILSAQALSQAGIPVILDLMWHSDIDFMRLMKWGVENKINWFAMNFQTLRKGQWAEDLILSSLDKVFKVKPDAKVIANGISSEKRIKAVVKRFGNKVIISNFGAFLKAKSGMLYNEQEGKWVKTGLTKSELWKQTLNMYMRWGKE